MRRPTDPRNGLAADAAADVVGHALRPGRRGEESQIQARNERD